MQQSVFKNVCRLKISNISKLQNVSTGDIYVHNIPWKVWFHRCTLRSKEIFQIILTCEDKSPRYTHVASASYKMMVPGETGVEAFAFSIEPNVFTNNGIGKELSFPWIDLKNKFVCKNDDSLKLDIEITAVNSQYEHRSELKCKVFNQRNNKTRCQITVTNLSDLLALRTPVFIVQNLPWDIVVYKSNAGFLEIRLQLKREVSVIQTVLNLSIMLHSPEKPSRSRNIVRTLHFGDRDSSKISIIPWEELLNDIHLVSQNSIKLDVDIEAVKRNYITAVGRLNSLGE